MQLHSNRRIREQGLLSGLKSFNLKGFVLAQCRNVGNHLAIFLPSAAHRRKRDKRTFVLQPSSEMFEIQQLICVNCIDLCGCACETVLLLTLSIFEQSLEMLACPIFFVYIFVFRTVVIESDIQQIGT